MSTTEYMRNTATVKYDRFGNVTKATDALGNSTVSEYNLMGLPTKQTDRNGNVTTNTYNPYGSLLTSHVSGGGADTVYDVSEDIVNTYNKNGMLISSAVGENNITAYTYDVYGNTASETTNGVTNTYTYDVNGNRKTYSQTENGASLMSGTYTYDSLDRLTNVNFGGISAAYTYDANNRLLTETRGSHTSTYTYNKAGLVTYLQNSSGDMYNYSYTYRLDGNQLTKYDGEYTDMYTYNDLGQLTSEYMHYDTTYFEYDTRGNRIEAYENNKWYTTEYEYDKNNRLIGSYKYSDDYSDETSVEYEYDANGNLLFKGIGITDDGTDETKDAYLNGSVDYGTSYIYNTRGQMTGVLTDSKTISYAYDPIGRRSSKTVNGQTSNHYWDGSDIVREIGANNTLYYRGINIIAQKSGNNINYYLRDAHGDTIGLTDGTSGVIKDYKHDAFGNLAFEYGTRAETPFRYNGQYYDEESGLYYLRNRYYNPELGRFLTEDPAKDGLNWYIYCNNDPVNMADQWGLAPFDLFSTPDDAAADFGFYIGQKSIDIEEEFASFIFQFVDKKGEVYYYYDEPRNDKKTHEERMISFSISCFGIEPVSLVHAHGAYDANTDNLKDVFSSPGNVASNKDDESDAHQSDESGLDYYLVTPNGFLKKYTANSGNWEGELLRTDMPVDSRIEIAQHMRNTLLWNLLEINYPNSSPQDWVNARRNNPDSLLDMLNVLERFR